MTTRWRSLPLQSALSGWKDVAYTAARHHKQKLDIAVPGNAVPRRKRPVCVFVHGGSWQRGDKAGAFNNGIDEAFARSGYVGVSVNYRLSPEVEHPAHALDVASAVRWIHSNIDKYGGDPNQLVLVGHSAGAHLVMQVLADPQYLRDVGLERSATEFITCAVGISGVYNIVRMANTAFYGALVATPAFGERVDQWREASVTATLVKQGATSPLVHTPVLLLTADDDFHFGDDAAELASWLAAAGNTRVERHVVAQRNHFSILGAITASGAAGGSSTDTAMQHITSFIDRLARDETNKCP